MSTQMGRIPQLDGIRGVAVLMVLVWHYFCGNINAETHSTLAYLNRAFGLMWSGVDLFFVLSGFLITGILMDNASSPNYFKVFYIRRVCRIFPLYFLTILLFVLFGWFLTGPGFRWLFAEPLPLWSYLTFTQNFVMGFQVERAYWLGLTWSIAVEEHFYLILPFLVYVLPRKVLPYVFVAAIVSAPMIRFFWSGNILAYVGTPCRADSLIMGSLIAWGIRNSSLTEKLRRNISKIYWVLASCLVIAAVLLKRGPRLGGVVEHFCLAILYGSLILIIVLKSDGLLSRFLQSPILVWLGTLSYGLYIFHQPVSGLIHGWLA